MSGWGAKDSIGNYLIQRQSRALTLNYLVTCPDSHFFLCSQVIIILSLDALVKVVKLAKVRSMAHYCVAGETGVARLTLG